MHEQFLEDMSKVDPNIRILSQYTGNKNNVECQCLLDNTKFVACPSNLLNKNTGCPTCAKIELHNKLAYTKDEINSIIKERNLMLLDDFQNIHTSTNVLCNKCNNSFKIRPASLLYKNSSCPYCGGTQGERKLYKILTKYGYNPTAQYIFEDCKLLHSLRFDFYDENHNIAFEYNGEQHYKLIDFSGHDNERAKLNFDLTKKRDAIKIEYCKKNNIPLIIIPYWEFDNMECFVLEELKRRNLIISK